jgi:outer membrane lipoprotein-sorting protein
MAAWGAGCAAPPAEHLPAYQWVDAPSALHDLCERSQRVHSLSAETSLTLTRSNGDTIHLDGAIAMRLPDSVRMRTWKFGQAVFDLTATPGGLWIEAPPDPERRGQVMPASLSAAKMARAWAVISGEFFCAADARVVDVSPSLVGVERNIGGQRIVCEVQRATLTPRKYSVFDADGVLRFTLTLDHYDLIGGIPWAVKLTAKSEGGLITIELKDPELNGELAPNAFVPPRKAEKMP